MFELTTDTVHAGGEGGSGGQVQVYYFPEPTNLIQFVEYIFMQHFFSPGIELPAAVVLVSPG